MKNEIVSAFAEVFGSLAFLILLVFVCGIGVLILHWIAVELDDHFGWHLFDGLSKNEKSSMFDYYMYKRRKSYYKGGTKMEIVAKKGYSVGDIIDGKMIIGFVGYNQPNKDNPNVVYCTEESTETFDESYIKAQYLAVNGDIITVKAIVKVM